MLKRCLFLTQLLVSLIGPPLCASAVPGFSAASPSDVPICLEGHVVFGGGTPLDFPIAPVRDSCDVSTRVPYRRFHSAPSFNAVIDHPIIANARHVTSRSEAIKEPAISFSFSGHSGSNEDTMLKRCLFLTQLLVSLIEPPLCASAVPGFSAASPSDVPFCLEGHVVFGGGTPLDFPIAPVRDSCDVSTHVPYRRFHSAPSLNAVIDHPIIAKARHVTSRSEAIKEPAIGFSFSGHSGSNEDTMLKRCLFLTQERQSLQPPAEEPVVPVLIPHKSAFSW
ncbi:uncharacterized protein LOC142803159 [Rhipicephalus microplus]|uniref:uncharacterized protein LOC142803159 n=1 Tax=Rhipicephalus microplus TaxID=6941 RepID=UPI003F6D603B